jgi:hypothetical protein
MVISLLRRIGILVPVLALALLVASPAGATPETLKRSFSNLLMAPLDLVLSPYTGAKSAVVNIQDIDDSRGVRIAYFVPGVIWNIGLSLGTSALRAVAGVLEMGPGLVLVPFDADLDPMFAPAERQEAMVDTEIPGMYIKFGVFYLE